jgi:hypothetical protein
LDIEGYLVCFGLEWRTKIWFDCDYSYNTYALSNLDGSRKEVNPEIGHILHIIKNLVTYLRQMEGSKRNEEGEMKESISDMSLRSKTRG